MCVYNEEKEASCDVIDTTKLPYSIISQALGQRLSLILQYQASDYALLTDTDEIAHTCGEQ
jgi:hypothetical protein